MILDGNKGFLCKRLFTRPSFYGHVLIMATSGKDPCNKTKGGQSTEAPSRLNPIWVEQHCGPPNIPPLSPQYHTFSTSPSNTRARTSTPQQTPHPRTAVVVAQRRQEEQPQHTQRQPVSSQNMQRQTVTQMGHPMVSQSNATMPSGPMTPNVPITHNRPHSNAHSNAHGHSQHTQHSRTSHQVTHQHSAQHSAQHAHTPNHSNHGHGTHGHQMSGVSNCCGSNGPNTNFVAQHSGHHPNRQMNQLPNHIQYQHQQHPFGHSPGNTVNSVNGLSPMLSNGMNTVIHRGGTIQQLPVSNNQLSLVSPTSTSSLNYAPTASVNTTNTTASSSPSARNLLIVNPTNNTLSASMSYNRRSTGSPGNPISSHRVSSVSSVSGAVSGGIPLIPQNNPIPLQQRQKHNVSNIPPKTTANFQDMLPPIGQIGTGRTTNHTLNSNINPNAQSTNNSVGRNRIIQNTAAPKGVGQRADNDGATNQQTRLQPEESKMSEIRIPLNSALKSTTASPLRPSVSTEDDGLTELERYRLKVKPWWIGQRIVCETEQRDKLMATIKDYFESSNSVQLWYDNEESTYEKVQLDKLLNWTVANTLLISEYHTLNAKVGEIQNDKKKKSKKLKKKKLKSKDTKDSKEQFEDRPLYKIIDVIPDKIDWKPMHFEMLQRVKILYRDGQWYTAFIDGYDPISRRHHVNYGDTAEWLWATKERIKRFKMRIMDHAETLRSRIESRQEFAEPPPWDPEPYGLDERWEEYSRMLEDGQDEHDPDAMTSWSPSMERVETEKMAMPSPNSVRFLYTFPFIRCH